MLVTDMIRRGAEAHGARTAILFGDDRLSVADVDALSSRLARALAGRLGLAPGTRVGLLADNGPTSMALDFACATARLTRVPLNARLSAEEQQRMLGALQVRALIHGPGFADRAAGFAGVDAIALDDLLALADACPSGRPDFGAEPDDVVLALYTSGTTGRLKAVEHTQRSYAAITNNILLNLIVPRPGDAMLHAASMIHASGTFVLPYWVKGGAAAILPGFQPAAYLEAIARWRPSAINLVPTMLAMLLDTPGIEAADLSSVETIIYGAAPMPAPLIARAIDLWGPRFVQYYGQTEAPLCIAVLDKTDHADPALRLACGRPSLDCEVRLVDAQGKDSPPGAAGEIAVRAPFAMKGYADAPDLDAETRLPGGWIRTRDIGRFDARGYLHLVDRTSDMIVTGGYNVYPRDVEEVLAAHPSVREVVVVGLPDGKWGEAVTAFVALRAGHAGDEMAIIAHARAALAGYKVPKSVRFIDEIPKSAVGKLLRRAVREPFWQGHERRI